MLPQVLQPPEYGTPVAELLIDGLCICCFNRSLMEWEIAFLRDSRHEMEIKIRKVDLEGRVLGEAQLQTPPVDSKLIRLTLDNGSVAHFDDFEKGFFKALPRFSRAAGDDSYDYRWVFDFVGREAPHGNFRRFVKDKVKVTIVTIPNALFFTKRVTKDSVILTLRDGEPEDGYVLGRTNHTVGAAIYATSPGNIRLDHVGGGSLLEVPLPHGPEYLYEISLTNMDITQPEFSPARRTLGEYVEGDFKTYYQVLEVTGAEHTLFAPRRGPHGVIDGDCHAEGVGHNGGNIDTLMPLIQS